MGKKVKRLAKAKSDGQFAVAVKESANQIWLAGLGAFSKAQSEGTRVFNSLIREGEKVQERAKKAASKAQTNGTKLFEQLVKEGEKFQAHATKVAGHSITDARTKASGAWGKLETVFEDRVARALHTLNVPTKKDIDTLGRRVSELTAATKKLGTGHKARHAASE